MQLTFGHPSQADLPRIMQIEHAGFTPEEAASETAMRERIDLINDSFIVARNAAGEVLGYVVGPVVNARYIHDDLFKKSRANPPTAATAHQPKPQRPPRRLYPYLPGKSDSLLRKTRLQKRRHIRFTACRRNLV